MCLRLVEINSPIGSSRNTTSIQSRCLSHLSFLPDYCPLPSRFLGDFILLSYFSRWNYHSSLLRQRLSQYRKKGNITLANRREVKRQNRARKRTYPHARTYTQKRTRARTHTYVHGTHTQTNKHMQVTLRTGVCKKNEKPLSTEKPRKSMALLATIRLLLSWRRLRAWRC